MEKKFTKFELARLKRTAQNVDQYITKKNKLVKKITELQEELDGVNNMIELTDAPTVAMTGFHTEEIIKKVVTPTDKMDKNGNIIKKTDYEFIYPETIVPPVTEESESNGCIGDAAPETSSVVPEDTDGTKQS